MKPPGHLAEDGENTASVQSEFLNINLYENQLLLLDRAFTSPLHDRGNVHYRYYILDTLDRGGRPCFHMAFVPRRRGELTFEGEMWIDTLSLGLRHVEAKISEGANINFVRNYAWRQTYELDSGRWVLAREENLADISLREGGMGIYSHQTIVNHNFEQATSWPDSVWTSGRDMSFAKGSHEVLESTWQDLGLSRSPPGPNARTGWSTPFKPCRSTSSSKGLPCWPARGTSSQARWSLGLLRHLQHQPDRGRALQLGRANQQRLLPQGVAAVVRGLRHVGPRWKYGGFAEWVLRKTHAPKCSWSTSETWTSSA